MQDCYIKNKKEFIIPVTLLRTLRESEPRLPCADATPTISISLFLSKLSEGVTVSYKKKLSRDHVAPFVDCD
jgi:hypothetical protein